MTHTNVQQFYIYSIEAKYANGILINCKTQFAKLVKVFLQNKIQQHRQGNHYNHTHIYSSKTCFFFLCTGSSVKRLVKSLPLSKDGLPSTIPRSWTHQPILIGCTWTKVTFFCKFWVSQEQFFCNKNILRKQLTSTFYAISRIMHSKTMNRSKYVHVSTSQFGEFISPAEQFMVSVYSMGQFQLRTHERTKRRRMPKLYYQYYYL